VGRDGFAATVTAATARATAQAFGTGTPSASVSEIAAAAKAAMPTAALPSTVRFAGTPISDGTRYGWRPNRRPAGSPTASPHPVTR